MMNFDEEMNVAIVDLANAQAKEKSIRKFTVISGIIALFLVAVAMMNGGTPTATVLHRHRHLQLKASTDNGGEQSIKETPALFVRHLQSKGPAKQCDVMHYTAGDVAGHATRNDCWFILYDVVYDITDYVDIHPGGSSQIYDECGTDATLEYARNHGKSVVNNHGKSYKIGRLGTESGVQQAACL
jgi:cytochrome b involved in lipid metabolism